MILVDTSVWVDHLRADDATLGELLNHSQVLMHPFVLGELACGYLRNRGEVLRLLGDLPQTTVVSDEEVLFFIERNSLMGRGKDNEVDETATAEARLATNVPVRFCFCSICARRACA